ncbi:MAG: hypothetical protein AAB443_00470 [Patescibacteria group bacterium]
MAKVKSVKKSKTSRLLKEDRDVEVPSVETKDRAGLKPSFKGSKLFVQVLVVVLVLVVLSFLGLKYKSLIINAQVDHSPIFSWQLNSALRERYGQRTLDEIITVKLIENELYKKEIEVTDDDLNGKVAEIEKSLQGMSLTDALSAQGMTVEVFKKQVRLQLGIEKYIASKVIVSDEEIKGYLDQNKESLEGSSDEDKQKTAREVLKDQKMQDEIASWIEDLKKNAKINIYI